MNVEFFPEIHNYHFWTHSDLSYIITHVTNNQEVFCDDISSANAHSRVCFRPVLEKTKMPMETPQYFMAKSVQVVTEMDT